MLSSSGLAESRCACARACSLFTGRAGQHCGNSSIKEGSEAVLSSRFLRRSLFPAVS